MRKILSRLNRRRAMSLTEIILAMALLATAFIPIIGVMGTSIKATDKDDRTIKAVNLCQEKLNQALQFPFGILEPAANQSKSYGSSALETLKSSSDANGIILRVGPDSILDPETGNKFEFKAELTVTDRPGSFKVPMYDPFEKANNSGDPSKWGWSEQDKAYEGMIYEYSMKITWQDKGEDREKFYTLSTFKSKVRDTK